MPKYPFAVPFDIVRVVLDIQKDLLNLKLQLGAAGIPIGNQSGTSGSSGAIVSNVADPPGSVQPMMMSFHTASSPQPDHPTHAAVLSDEDLTEPQKQALIDLHLSYLRSNQQAEANK